MRRRSVEHRAIPIMVCQAETLLRHGDASKSAECSWRVPFQRPGWDCSLMVHMNVIDGRRADGVVVHTTRVFLQMLLAVIVAVQIRSDSMCF